MLPHAQILNIFMQRIFRRVIFLFVIAFMTFALVASSGISRRSLLTENPTLTSCTEESASNCQPQAEAPPEAAVAYAAVIPYVPDPQQPPKERFIGAITDKLPMIPQPGTLDYILLRSYGAVFATEHPEVKLPPKLIFSNELQTKQFQASLNLVKINGSSSCMLQKAAAQALNQARSQVAISLRSGNGGSDCTRSFATTYRFWRRYAKPNTLERVRRGEETAILSIVAPPGASQHLWGLAVDLQVSNSLQRQVLNNYGWFQTVEKDTPHWTYVGLEKAQMSNYGFQAKVISGITYWITPL